jgi:hypothetical protein
MKSRQRQVDPMARSFEKECPLMDLFAVRCMIIATRVAT